MKRPEQPVRAGARTRGSCWSSVLCLTLTLILLALSVPALSGVPSAAVRSDWVSVNSLRSGYRYVQCGSGWWVPLRTVIQVTRTTTGQVVVRIVAAPSLVPAPVPNETPAPAPAASPSPAPTDEAALEARMVGLVNAERAKLGLPALKVDAELTRLARLKSADMVKLNYFSHTSPSYGSPFAMMRAAGVRYTYAGENLAGASSLAIAHESLMQSSGHRANILRKEFTHIGIGIVRGGPYGYMFTQLFVGQ